MPTYRSWRSKPIEEKRYHEMQNGPVKNKKVNSFKSGLVLLYEHYLLPDGKNKFHSLPTFPRLTRPLH